MKYSPQLDGLRGVAIVIVMIFHAGVPYFNGGFIGVDIFFVLSGFLITLLLLQEHEKNHSVSLKNFYARRILRLAPALFLLLFAFCLYSLIWVDKTKATSNYIDALISLLYLSNWSRAMSIHPPDFLGHTWSLSIEEQFYFLWPLTLLAMLSLLKNLKYVFALTALLAVSSWFLRIYLSLNGATIERMYNGLDTRADALMVGCALAVLLQQWHKKGTNIHHFRRLISFGAMLACACLIMIVYKGNWRDTYMYHFGFFAIEIFVAVLLVEILTNPKGLLSMLLSRKWIVWIGSISYGLYLWHYPIFRVLRNYGADTLTVVIAGFPTTFIVAVISYYALERPMLRFKYYFLDRHIDHRMPEVVLGGGRST
jgi:peptidoglycan/LPS O-acetylase OafA/YrhL